MLQHLLGGGGCTYFLLFHARLDKLGVAWRNHLPSTYHAEVGRTARIYIKHCLSLCFCYLFTGSYGW
jgi:hypothetical protein